MEKGILRAIIVYNAFLPVQFLLLPRTAPLALALHLGLIRRQFCSWDDSIIR